MMHLRRFVSPLALIAFCLPLFSMSPVSAGEPQTTGEVTVRVTLTGDVDERDAFVVWHRCDDPWCAGEAVSGGPAGHPVVACGVGLADHPVCSATTYEWTVDLATGSLEYEFVRLRDVLGANEHQVQHVGSWEIHAGQQVISLGYDYPSPVGMLPDTALQAP